MVKITEELIRKRAEHNEGEIYTLEEISLHQQDIEKIEYIDKWCRELRILYLQNNLIGKIENVGRLKCLEYLNLALNNIEVVENLENCESLKKLDLTVNFVGILSSIKCLQNLHQFEELYLTGNPCTTFEGYRDFVIACLPQLKTLDGNEISRSERIIAFQMFSQLHSKIRHQEEQWLESRAQEKIDARKRQELRKLKTTQNDDENDDDSFWKEETPFTPESRLETHEYMEEKKRKEQSKEEKIPQPERRLFANDGRALNINEPKIEFKFTEDDQDNSFKLDVAMYKYMDTSLMDCDVQPNYVRVTLKGKLLQLALPDEVRPDSSTAKRSQTTGHLVVTMPKVKGMIKPQKKMKSCSAIKTNSNKSVSETVTMAPDWRNIVLYKEDSLEIIPRELHTANQPQKSMQQRRDSVNFVDDPSVPPLE